MSDNTQKKIWKTPILKTSLITIETSALSGNVGFDGGGTPNSYTAS